jgi:hypothetical protein
VQTDDALLDDVQRETFGYFLHEVNERNGLVADCTRPGWPQRTVLDSTFLIAGALLAAE